MLSKMMIIAPGILICVVIIISDDTVFRQIVIEHDSNSKNGGRIESD